MRILRVFNRSIIVSVLGVEEDEALEDIISQKAVAL